MNWSAERVSAKNLLYNTTRDQGLIEGAECLRAVALARVYGGAVDRFPWACTEARIYWQRVQGHLAALVQIRTRPQGSMVGMVEDLSHGQD